MTLLLHQNKQHPHVHVVVNNVGYDLKPLSRNRDDLMRWRESFARELRAQGIERGIGRDEAHVAEVRARENRELAERTMKDAIEKLGQQGKGLGGCGERREVTRDYAIA